MAKKAKKKEPAPVKKSKRGKRGPYGPRKPKPEIKTETPAPDKTETPAPDKTKTPEHEKTGEAGLYDFLNDYAEEKEETPPGTPAPDKTETPPPSKPKADLSKLINGKMLLYLLNFIVPSTIKFLFGLFDKRAKKVALIDIALDEQQTACLEEAADEVAVYIFEKANPLVLFFICSGAMYAANFNSALHAIPKEPDTDVNELIKKIAELQAENEKIKKKK